MELTTTILSGLKCLCFISEICHNTGRSSGSPILEELLMFIPNSGSSSSSTGKRILQLKGSEGAFGISQLALTTSFCGAFCAWGLFHVSSL